MTEYERIKSELAKYESRFIVKADVIYLGLNQITAIKERAKIDCEYVASNCDVYLFHGMDIIEVKKGDYIGFGVNHDI